MDMEGRPTQTAVAALRPAVYRFLLKAVGNPAEAEDLAQDTLAHALKNLDGFRNECRLSTWLFGIALNVARNHARLARHRIEISDPQFTHLPGGDDPSAALLRNQDQRILRRAIDGLPDEFRDTILLVSLEELSYDEAAAALKIPVGTVRSRLSRGRLMLREALTEMGYGRHRAEPQPERSAP